MNPNEAELTFRKMPITSLIEILTFIKEYKVVVPTCPVDVFLGSHDGVVDSKKTAEFFSESANVTIHWLTHSAHVLPLDLDLTTISACINDHTGK